MKSSSMKNGFVVKSSMPANPSVAKKASVPHTQEKKQHIAGYAVKSVSQKVKPFA